MAEECARATHTLHPGCPPRMTDGRLFTDYRPRSDVHLEHLGSFGSAHEHRAFLISSGESLMAASRSAARETAGSFRCVRDPGTMLPEADRFVCDAASCDRLPTGARGGGLSVVRFIS